MALTTTICRIASSPVGSSHVTELPAVEGSLLPSLTSLLAEAFRDDPMVRWLFPNETRRVRRLRRTYELDVRHRLNGRAIPFVVQHSGVAFWHPPGDVTLPAWAALRIAPGYASVGARHPLRALRVLSEVIRRRPPDPHWYLSHLAVDPGHRSEGLGRRLLQVGCSRADHEGVGVYLETTNPANLAFYAAAGFQQAGCVEVPGAPPVWSLSRTAGRGPRPGR
jgi:ribosomal protein S18 acetylase RimI-like enzyme